MQFSQFDGIGILRCVSSAVRPRSILHVASGPSLALSPSLSLLLFTRFLSFRFPSSLFQRHVLLRAAFLSRHRFWAPFRTLSPRHVDYIPRNSWNTERGALHGRSPLDNRYRVTSWPTFRRHRLAFSYRPEHDPAKTLRSAFPRINLPICLAIFSSISRCRNSRSSRDIDNPAATRHLLVQTHRTRDTLQFPDIFLTGRYRPTNGPN